jgi:hypothetical protein
MLNLPLEARNNVRAIFVLLVGNLGLVVEVLSAQSLELLAGVLFAFSGSVLVAQSTLRCQLRGNSMISHLDRHTT